MKLSDVVTAHLYLLCTVCLSTEHSLGEVPSEFVMLEQKVNKCCEIYRALHVWFDSVTCCMCSVKHSWRDLKVS